MVFDGQMTLRQKRRDILDRRPPFKTKINCTVQRSRALQDERDLLLRKRARAKPLALAELAEGAEKGRVLPDGWEF